MFGRPPVSSDADIVRQLCERDAPFPSRLDIVGARRCERAAREQHIDDRANAFAVSALGDVRRLLRRREQLDCGGHPRRCAV